jgi:hypothetical protein
VELKGAAALFVCLSQTVATLCTAPERRHITILATYPPIRIIDGAALADDLACTAAWAAVLVTSTAAATVRSDIDVLPKS